MFSLRARQPQPQHNPFARLLASLLLIAVGAIALFFGAVIIAVLIGLAAILFIFLYLRAWWLHRQLGLNVHPHRSRKRHHTGVTIEGEYTVQDSDKKSRDVN